MRYLRDFDYRYKISQDDLSVISDNNAYFMFNAEIDAQAQTELFLRKRYDLTMLFKTYGEFVSGTTYYSGDTVWFSVSGSNELLYTVAVSATTSLPTMSGWTQSDPRYRAIKNWIVTMSIYKLHEKISPESIPLHRKDAYDEVLKSLKMIQEGKLSPDFPEIENRVNTISIGGDIGESFLY